MNLAGFEKIAPHLSSPLVLLGFVMLLAYGIHGQLTKSGLLRQVTQKDSGLIIRLFLRYGFWLALTLLVAGFGLAGWSKYVNKVNRVDASKQSIKTVEAPNEQPKIKHEQNNFQTVRRKEIELDPDNPARWNKLGLLLLYTGELDQAEEAFQKLLALGEAHQDKESQAIAYGNLGLVYRSWDNIDQAEAYWKKSLLLYQEMGMPDTKDIQQRLDELSQYRASLQASPADDTR
ncbi:MAG: tetratricopeptide repeat protein [Candidatus Electrothrix aestuarii]|uniref:Tetratricopeptide repeat protein n=1 Tax=Candidatus Electrothrix aestuarii TaxID=3062594 RepID=A0AAU8LUB8_9BACT|nr:tetratricopeptide repeat protein [Candidatus Electrothrix aestuarii]